MHSEATEKEDGSSATRATTEVTLGVPSSVTLSGMGDGTLIGSPQISQAYLSDLEAGGNSTLCLDPSEIEQTVSC
jgi:hypothetical protein